MKNTLICLAAVVLLSTAGCHSRQAGGPARTTVKAIAAKPAAFMGRTVEVTGVLNNAGANYFTDLKLVIEDGAGNRVAVRPWLILEIPPLPANQSKARRPEVQSNYLGMAVTITGRVIRDGEQYLLQVDTAARLPETGEK